MKKMILSLVIMAPWLEAIAQDSRIIDVTPTNLTFVVEQTNVHVGLYTRFDMAMTDTFPLWPQTWRAYGLSWDAIATNYTNSVEINGYYFPYMTPSSCSNPYFRIVASTNSLPVHNISFELTLVNATTSLFTGVDLHMIGADNSIMEFLPPSTTNLPSTLRIRDFVGVISGSHGMIVGYYIQEGHSNNVFFMPEYQRMILKFSDSTYSVTNK